MQRNVRRGFGGNGVVLGLLWAGLGLLEACSPAPSGVEGGAGGGVASGGSVGIGGSSAGGQTATGGTVGGAGGSAGGASAGGASAGGSSSGGAVEPAGGSGGSESGGASGSGGASSGGSDASGGNGSGGGQSGTGGGSPGPNVCNQFMGGALMDELFIHGFESQVDDSRWQLKWKNYASIEEWANAQSSFWDAPIESACASGSAAPERVVLMVFSWSVTSQSDWTNKLTQTVNNVKAKYPSATRLDLMTQITGPDNMLCPTPPASGETIVVSAELHAALAAVAAAFPGYVFLSPEWEAQSCADFVGGGPHLTDAGNMLASGPIATYFDATD